MSQYNFNIHDSTLQKNIHKNNYEGMKENYQMTLFML